MVTYPKDWNSLTLGDLGSIKMCRRIFSHQTEKSGQIPFYKIGTFGKKADAYITRDLYESYKTQYPYPQKGNVLISAAGTIGRTVVFDGKDAYFQDSNIVWLDTSDDEVDNAFLKYFYESYPWTNLEGTTIRRLYNSLISGTFISLPSLPEQKAIAETLSCIDAHIANLTELIEKKRGIRDGALEDLVSGRTRLKGVNVVWEKTELGQIASYRKGRTTSAKKHYISTENMRQGFAGITPYSGSYTVYGCEFCEGDILMANIRPYLKKIWYADFSGSCSADVLVVHCNEDIASKYLYYLVANDRFINFVMNGGTKGIKMPRGDKEFIMHYPVLIPTDVKIQQTISDMLTSMDEEIIALEEEKDKMLQIKAGVMDDLLTGRVRLMRQGG